MRIIFSYISHGVDGGLNAGIPPDWCSGETGKVQLPNPDNLVDRMIALGRGLGYHMFTRFCHTMLCPVLFLTLINKITMFAKSIRLGFDSTLIKSDFI